MKKNYIKPEIGQMLIISESVMQSWSIDNTGKGGDDGERYTVIDGDLGNGEEVNSKGNSFWDDEW